MSVKKLIFWTHLVSGLLAGAVIAIMSITGIGIAFEEEILAWSDRDVSQIDDAFAAEKSQLPLEELTLQVKEARPEFRTSAVRMHSDPSLAWVFLEGRKGHLYVNPYTAVIRDSRSHGAHKIIHELEEWHRWLGAKDNARSTGRLITGIANVAFVVLCVTGLYLWFPRKWSRRALRAIIALKFSYKGKARDFNWHNVFGFWSLSILLVLSITAVVISFEWGHRLVFTVAGEKPPESRNYGMMAVPPPIVPTPAEGASVLSLDTATARIAEAFPDWESITLQLPGEDAPTEPLDFGVTVPDHMPSRGFIPVMSDPFTGEILQTTRFQDRSPGLQARVWMRFLHTGAAFGLPGKIVAALGCLAALVLVWTGFALSWRRFFRKRRRPAATT